MRPADVDLNTCEFIGCLPSVRLSEKQALGMLIDSRVRGCLEWFYDTDEALESIANLGLMPVSESPLRKRRSADATTRAYELSESAREQRRAAAKTRWDSMRDPLARREALRPAFSVTPGATKRTP